MMKNRLKAGLAGLLVVGGVAMNGGCNQRDAALLMSAAAPYSKDARAAQALSAAGSGLLQSEIAREGRTNVNVNINQADGNPSQQSLRREHLSEETQVREGFKAGNDPLLKGYVIVSYNFSKDFNRNGVIDIPSELVGIKTQFREDERMEIKFITLREKDLIDLECKLYDGRGNVINQGSVNGPGIKSLYNLQKEEYIEIFGEDRLNEAVNLIPGTYRYNIYHNNRFITGLEFQIIPSQ
jgi:hypothetical protein